MATETDLYEAKTRFISFHEGNGRPVVVEHRTVARKGHPIIDANPTMFRPLTVDFDTRKEPEPDPAQVEYEQLVAEAEGLRVKVDKRWSLDRLRGELDKAKAAQAKDNAEGDAGA